MIKLRMISLEMLVFKTLGGKEEVQRDQKNLLKHFVPQKELLIHSQLRQKREREKNKFTCNLSYTCTDNEHAPKA